MSVEVVGFVEFRYDSSEVEWIGLLDITPICESSPAIFGALFGMRGLVEHLVDGPRGMPEGISPEMRDSWVGDRPPSSLTWVLCSELGPFRTQDEVEIGRYPNAVAEDEKDRSRLERSTIVVPPCWRLIFNVMHRLGEGLGPENARIVVF